MKGVTLNADLEPKINHQPMTYGYSHFTHFKTVATEVEIKIVTADIKLETHKSLEYHYMLKH